MHAIRMLNDVRVRYLAPTWIKVMHLIKTYHLLYFSYMFHYTIVLVQSDNNIHKKKTKKKKQIEYYVMVT